MSPVRRYHPALVALHWSMAVLVIASLALGALKMAPLSNTDPMKLEALRAHMAGGVLILALLTARIITRQRTARPAPVSARLAAFDNIRPIAHGLLYALVLGMTLSGLTMALQAGLFPIVYAGHGRLPPSLWVYPIRWVHFGISRALMAVIALHVAALPARRPDRADVVRQAAASGGGYSPLSARSAIFRAAARDRGSRLNQRR